jgi:hypothetical protein
MLEIGINIAIAGGCFPPCQRGDSLLQGFPRAASGVAIGVAFGFHPSVQASNIFETANFRVVSFAFG